MNEGRADRLEAALEGRYHVERAEQPKGAPATRLVVRRLQRSAVTGQRDQALAEFEGLLEVRNQGRMTPGFWQFDPFLGSLRDDSDFQALAACIPAS